MSDASPSSSIIYTGKEKTQVFCNVYACGFLAVFSGAGGGTPVC